MRKRIGLLIGEQDGNYSSRLVSSITASARELDYDIFVFANYGTYDHNIILYGEGESSVYKIPDLDTFSGFVIDETLYNIDGMAKAVYDYFNQNSRIPITFLKGRSERFYDLLLDDMAAIKSITNHFIKDHGFTRICHMTGRWELQDARNRYKGYEEAMLEAGLDVTDSMVFYGNYWSTHCAEAAAFFTQDKDNLPQAIVCANDFMAVPLIDELRKLGFRVPEDICVSGYDNEEESKIHKVTTMDANVEEFGRTAMLSLHKAITGEFVPKEQCVPSTFIFRDSCGCAKCQDYNALEYELSHLNRHYFGIDMSVYMYNGYQMSFDIDSIFANADRYYQYNLAEYSYICLCDDTFNSFHRPIEKINEYSDKMILKRIFYRDPNKSYDSPEITFDRKELLPIDILEKADKPMLYFVNPIHSQNKCYGYMVSVYKDGEFPYHYTQPFCSALGNAIDSYNINNEYMGLEEIKSLYLLDALTGLNNRRGFEQGMSLVIDRAKRHPIHISVASIDMDGLKFINDNYGHSAGDECIKALANALKSIVSEEEIVARYGGDEFGAIMVSKNADRYTHFEEDLSKAIEIENNKLSDKPYKLHASVGISYVGFGNIPSLANAFQKADKLMYANKQAYKETLKDNN